ncbi:MAG: TRAM domain-containing protein [Planctomycetota bacterium]
MAEPRPVIDRHAFEQGERQRRMLLKIVRAAFVIVFVTVAALAILATELVGERVAIGPLALRTTWRETMILALFFGALTVLIDLLTPQKKISTLAGVFVGLLTAMLLAAAVGFVIDLLVELYEIQGPDSRPPDFVLTGKLLIGIGLGYLCISTVLQTQDDFRLVIPYVEFAKQLRGPRALLLDSSTLIDARITDLAGTGLFQAPIVVPQVVLDELQTLADQPDTIKRAKGRRGLETVSLLQKDPSLDFGLDATRVPAASVDRALVDLAEHSDAIVVTTDAALASVASIRGVPVLNMHDIARACRPITAQGEAFAIRILREGEQPGQGVGYLDDGTMVVVNGAAGAIGRTIDVVASSTIPTAAGRLIFADPGEDSELTAASHGPPGTDPDQPTPAVQPQDAGETPENAQPDAEPTPVIPSATRPAKGPRTGSRAAARRNPRR